MDRIMPNRLDRGFYQYQEEGIIPEHVTYNV